MRVKLSSGIFLFWMLSNVAEAEATAAAEGNRPKDTPCLLRELKKGEKVCVCNSTYCDTIHPLPPFPSRMFNAYTSDKEGARFLFRRKNLSNWTNPKSITVTVNSSETCQSILGFGGLLSDAAALNLKSLSAGAQERLLASYFSERGLEYNLVRVPIGGTDHSDRPHSLDDVPGDAALHHFNLSSEDVRFKIPDLQKIKILSRKSIRLVATAWTAPPWMKTNDDYKGLGVLKDEYMNLWTSYHLRFLEEYEKHGLNFWAVTTGYQPSTGLIPFYPYNCMGWTPFSQAQWVADHLGPRLTLSPFNQTKIIVLDDLKLFLPWWPKIMFSNPKTKSYASGIGVQWYWDFILPPRLLELTHAEFPDKFIVATEASFNKLKGFYSPVALGSWTRAEEYVETMINDLNHWVSAWMDSSLVLDPKGGPSWVENFGDAAIIANPTADEFYKQPLFYAIGHFSKFIPEGSVRIDVKVSKSAVTAAGLKTPQGNVVVILLNKRTHDVPVTILGAKMGNANILLPKKSITTVIYRDKKKFPLFKVSF